MIFSGFSYGVVQNRLTGEAASVARVLLASAVTEVFADSWSGAKHCYLMEDRQEQSGISRAKQEKRFMIRRGEQLHILGFRFESHERDLRI